jgi:hypothetical protein
VEDSVRELVEPLVSNAYWVKSSIDMYDAISVHAVALNERHAHFFGLVQKFALDSAVLGICKMFDTSNKRYKKNTVPELFDYLERNLTSAYVQRLRPQLLVDLGVGEKDARSVVNALQRGSDFEEAKRRMLTLIGGVMPTVEQSPALEKLFVARNKAIAHQEQLDEALKEELKFLPSLADMEKLGRWVRDFCKLLYCVLTPDTALVDSVVSARMAALNVAARLLGKDFDDASKTAEENFRDWEAFYKREV